MGYALSILMSAPADMVKHKIVGQLFTRRFNGKAFWAYWVIWTAAITVSVNILPNDFDIVMQLIL